MKKYIATMEYIDKDWPYYREEEKVEVNSMEEAENWCKENSHRRQYYKVTKLEENLSEGH